MSGRRLGAPGLKGLLRHAYRAALGVHQGLSAATAGGGGAPRLFYGGARPGHGGGPKVKIGKLAAAFPEHWWTYNLVYVLSNAPYLPTSSLRRLKDRDIPIVSNQDGVFYPAWYGGDWRAQNRRMAEQYHLADHVFHQSDFCRRSADRFLGPRRGAGEVLYNAVDTTRFVPARRGGVRREPFVFLLSGKVQAHQAYRLEASVQGLWAACRRGLDGRLVIAGAIDSRAKAKARRLAARLDVAERVDILGPYRQPDAPALLTTADAYVMANHNDACPTSVIEAMSCGLPVVYARSGGVPELVGDEAGVGLETGESFDEVLVPAPEALGDAMVRVAENRESLAAAARARAVERFDIEPWLTRHREVFRTLMGGPHG